MRNKFFLWIVLALFLIVGCTENEIENEQPIPDAEGRTLVVTASMPGRITGNPS
jgi:ABC-type Fe3+-hydroxamate transport system substrate-binding protein